MLICVVLYTEIVTSLPYLNLAAEVQQVPFSADGEPRSQSRDTRHCRGGSGFKIRLVPSSSALAPPSTRLGLPWSNAGRRRGHFERSPEMSAEKGKRSERLPEHPRRGRPPAAP